MAERPRDPRLQEHADQLGISYDLVVARLLGSGPTVATCIDRCLLAQTPGTARTYRPPLVFLRDGWSAATVDIALVTDLAAEHGLELPNPLHASPVLPHTGVGDDRPHRRLVAGIGDQPITSISPTHLSVVQRWVRVRAQLLQHHRSHRRRSAGMAALHYDGRGAAETFVAAARCLFRHAAAEPDVHLAFNPAEGLRKPPRAPRLRAPMTDELYRQVWQVVQTTGRDPALDTLVFRLHAITAARQGGALALTLADVDHAGSMVRLQEKGDTIRWQPIPPSLRDALLDHAHERGVRSGHDSLLRYRDGHPLTGRRYDSLHRRVQKHLPWAQACKWDIHTLRVHTGATVERLFSQAVAAAYLGHAPRGTTGLYTRATKAEVIAAMEVLSGEAHPMGRGRDRSTIQPEENPWN